MRPAAPCGGLTSNDATRGREEKMFNWLRHNRDPDHLLEQRRRLHAALADDYPVYAPPHRQGPNYARGTQDVNDSAFRSSFADFSARAGEMFDYFLSHRDERISCLSAFLKKWDVQVDTDDDGLSAVSRWCPINCGALVADLKERSTRQEFLNMSTPWTGKNHGFNVIFDLGIFIGEYIIARNPRMEWKYRLAMSRDGYTSLSGYELEGIGDIEKTILLDPMVCMYRICLQAENDLRLQKVGHLVNATTLARVVRDYATR